jgi:molybdenum cofactor cytidylyltransferase
MGRPKQLLPFGKISLLRHAAETALATSFSPVVIVLGAEREACAAEIAGLPVLTAINSDWEQGMGSSLRAGVEMLEKHAPAVEGVLILLHDQPRVAAGTLRALVGLWEPPRHPIAAAFYGDAPGVPAVFDRSFFPDLKNLRGPEGAKKIILRHASAVASLNVPEAGDDIDSPEDYRRVSSEVI